MKTQRSLLSIVFLFSVVVSLSAQVSFSTIFADGMVLKRNSEVPIWGWGPAAEWIQIIGSWNPTDTVKVRVDQNGQWKTTIKTAEAGGPHTIQVGGAGTAVLNDVMFGEVWICSGQSNMEWSHNHNLANREEEIAAANHANIRIFHITKQGANTPQNRCEGKWEHCTPQSMRRTSGLGYFFARTLQEKLNIPIGIIVSAWGGTHAEVWIPEPMVTNDPILSQNKINPHPWWPEQPGMLYNQMIHPLAPFAISGAIWYQGESDVDHPHSYAHMMEVLIASWRLAFQQDFPFYFVQIAPFTYNKEKNEAAILREQQELATRLVPKTGMVVISDLVHDVKDIHPMNKLDVGKRLAMFACSEVYNLPIGAYKSPFFQSVAFQKGKAIVTLTDAEGGVVCRDKKVIGMKIAGSDGIFHDADIKILSSGKIEVWSNAVKEPVEVQYCFDDATVGNLFTISGLPVAPFRSSRR